LDDVTTSGTGSFATLECDGTATLDDVTTSGTGSFATLECDGTATLDDVTTSGTGSFGTLNCGGTATLNGLSLSGDNYMTLEAGSSANDKCVIKQVGGNNAYKLIFDFQDDGNDLEFGLRSNNTEKHTWNEGDYTAAGDITAFSDRRLKTEIKPIESALEKVKKLSGYTYIKDGRRSTGVIAQEVLEVLPEVVHGGEETMYSVAYGNMVGLLIEAIKELSER